LRIWDLRNSLECGGKRVLVTLVLRKGERDTALDWASGIADLESLIADLGMTQLLGVTQSKAVSRSTWREAHSDEHALATALQGVALIPRSAIRDPFRANLLCDEILERKSYRQLQLAWIAYALTQEAIEIEES
jgi:hypothetical protein